VESRFFYFFSFYLCCYTDLILQFYASCWNGAKEQIYETLRGKCFSGGIALQEFLLQPISRCSGSQDNVVFTCRRVEGCSVIHSICNKEEDNATWKV